jgi:hypothetical protein
MKIWQMPCLRGACIKARLGCSKFLYEGLSQDPSSRSFYDDLVRFSRGSWHADLGQRWSKSFRDL